MEKILYDAAQTIKDYCASHKDNCRGCQFNGHPVYGCFLCGGEVEPESWDLEAMEYGYTGN